MDEIHVPIQVGTYVKPEGWKFGSCLEKGLEGFCPFYLPTHTPPVKHIACRIEVTGRTRRRVEGEWMVRVKIIFIGDGEPDTITYGWIHAQF